MRDAHAKPTTASACLPMPRDSSFATYGMASFASQTNVMRLSSWPQRPDIGFVGPLAASARLIAAPLAAPNHSTLPAGHDDSGPAAQPGRAQAEFGLIYASSSPLATWCCREISGRPWEQEARTQLTRPRMGHALRSTHEHRDNGWHDLCERAGQLRLHRARAVRRFVRELVENN